MLAWYVGMAAVIVWVVFRDPRIDYRFLALGALAPGAVDAVAAGERAWAHTLGAAVGVLFAVVVVTAGRRPARPRLLMVPIGMLLHLSLDGMWAHPETFWWPFLGGSVRDGPILASLAGVLVREAAGLLALAWFARRFSLGDAGARGRLARTGTVEVTDP